jgi:transcriptional regulator with XRE-family HTH domain
VRKQPQTRALDTALGRTIEHERRKQRLTQERLAQLCGISRRHLAAIESGANFTMGIFFEIVRVLPGVLLPVGALLLLNAWPRVTRD